MTQRSRLNFFFDQLARYQVFGGVIVVLLLGYLNVHQAAYAQSQALPPTVRIAQHPDLGNILVGPNGMTLYYLTKESAETLRCWEDCAENWVPLMLGSSGSTARPVAPPGLKGQLTTSKRNRAIPEEREAYGLQVTYNGRPLYYWSRDTVPGEATGHGIGDIWFVAKP